MIDVKAKYDQMKAVVLYKGVLTLRKSVNETLVLDHSNNESCRAVISCDTVYHAVKKGSFNVQMKPCCVTPLQWKVLAFADLVQMKPSACL